MNTTAQDDTSLRGLVQIFWRDRWVILGITVLAALITMAVAFLTTKKYTATVVLSVVSGRSNNGMGGAASLLSQFGGVASLAGLSLNADSGRAEAVATLSSDVLTRQYVSEHKLLPVIFWKQWDAATQKWTVDDPKKVPTLWKASEAFKDIRSVSENNKSGLVTMNITWNDPKLAAQWANDLVKLTNDYMRSKAIQQSERNIAYLQEQAAKTDIAQVRMAIYNVLESEIRNAMLARGNEEYALRVIDPASVPEIQTSPKKVVWTIVGTVAGFFLAILVVLVRRAWSRP